MTEPLRLLIASFDFRPRLGGVASCAFDLARSLAAYPDIEIRVLAPHMDGDREFDTHGLFSTVRIPLPASATSAVAPLAMALRRQYRSWRPHGIVSLLWHPCGLAGLAGGFLTRGRTIPSFVLAHGVEVLESRSTLKKRIRAQMSFLKDRVFRSACAVFPVSHYTAGLLTAVCGVPADRMRVVYNGVDPELFRPGPKPAHLLERFGLAGKQVLLTVTRLEPYKGVDRAIGALRYAVPRQPDLVYLLCGDGYDRPRLQALVRSYGLDEHVIFAGAVPAPELVDYYNLADGFVLLTREDLHTPNVEGFGIVFLEAAACGKPTIGGRSGGIPDAVADGETGWLVDPNDEHAISRAFLECIGNPELARGRGDAGRRRVLAGFTRQHMAQRVLEAVRTNVRH